MAAIDTVYQYYLSTYGTKNFSRYDSHKRSELRHTYNNIVKANKESPLYKLKDDNGDVRRFAIDIKEGARHVKNVIASLSEEDGDIGNLFQKKVAVSDQEDVVSVEYIGDGSEDENTSSFTMEVLELAKPQVNQGAYLRSYESALPPGTYGFDLTTPSNSYEFQFNVGGEDTNREVQQKLSRLINNANIGLHAEVVEGERDTSALRIQSRRTGLGEGEDSLFRIEPQANNIASLRAVETLGLDQVENKASNSVFLLNGKERSSYANTFTINNIFEVKLNDVSPEGSPVNIGFKANADAVADNIGKMADAYNSILEMADRYRDTEQQSSKLIFDVSGVARRFAGEFGNIGLSVDENSMLAVDKDALREAVTSEDAGSAFDVLNRFKDALSYRADKASVDPMNYVHKIIVAYKNPGHNFATPYITSLYSGLFLDRSL